MRNSTNKSLNDLFRSAQSEAEQDILSQSEVERLLQSARRSVPVTQSIQQKLYQRLLSTPLKMGMTAMTTAACITLGLIAFWPQTPQPSTTAITKEPVLSHTNYGSERTEGGTQHFATPPRNKPSFVVCPLNEATLASVKIPETPIATADSLQPVELSPDQLAKLGIVLEDNGDIDFYEGVGTKDDYYNHFSLLPTGAVRMHFSTSHQKEPNVNILPPPKLITTASGAKRMFFLEFADSSHSKPQTEIIKNFVNESGKMDILPVFDDDSMLQKIVDTTINGNPITVRANVKNDFTQSIRNTISQTPGSHTRVSTETRVFVTDSLDEAFSKKFVDSISHFAIKKMIAMKKPIDSIPNVENFDLRMPDIDSVYGSFVSDPLNLNHLIPIRVVNLKNAEHPNELIFWYEPSPELTAAMPAAVNSTPAPQSKQLAISVYPNPTIGPATVHYQLSDAPRAYFSVRNLLGQEVLNGGVTSSTTGDAQLDLSQLPAGVYLLVTTTDNGERDVERVVVTK